MAKKVFIPHGLPGATPCPSVFTESNGGAKPPEKLVIIGIDDNGPTTDRLANFLLITFITAEVPPLPPSPKTETTEN